MTGADVSFWQATYRQHGSSILAFLTSRVGRREVAEDLLQETFVRAIRRRARLADAARMRSYLFTTAHRLVLDRRRRKRPALFSEVSESEQRRVQQRGDPEAMSPERSVDLRKLESSLRAALAELRPNQRVAFESAVLGQQAYAAVARQQGWTVEQVKMNVYRARRQVIARLREQLSPGSEPEP